MLGPPRTPPCSRPLAVILFWDNLGTGFQSLPALCSLLAPPYTSQHGLSWALPGVGASILLRVQRDPQTLKGQGLPHSSQLPEGRRPSRKPGNTAETPGQKAPECREWQAGESKAPQRVRSN